MNKIVILNGPPGSGKDTIADRMTGYTKRKFAEPLHFVSRIIGRVSLSEWESRFLDRSLKEKPWDRIGGMSVRQLLIMSSEDILKKIHGPAIMGTIAAESLCAGADYVFSDGGFKPEIQAVIDATKETHEVHVIQLYRKNCDFRNDSRDYVRDLKGPYWTYQTWNHEGLLAMTVDTVLELVNTKGYTE